MSGAALTREVKIRLTEQEGAELVKRAREQDRSVSALGRRAIREELARLRDTEGRQGRVF